MGPTKFLTGSTCDDGDLPQTQDGDYVQQAGWHVCSKVEDAFLQVKTGWEHKSIDQTLHIKGLGDGWMHVMLPVLSLYLLWSVV